MGLLAHYRRPWIAIIVALLAVPMLVQAVRPPQRVSEDEARVLSPAPAFPDSFGRWRRWPPAVDRFLADHFGFRDQLMHVHGIIRYALAAPSIGARVILGREEQLFYAGDAAFEQATGRVMRRAAIAAFADRAAQLQSLLKARHARFVVAIPPSAATILRARLPIWAADQPAMSEYDAMMAALAHRRVATVDLRPVLSTANSVWPVYRRTDMHWNRLGALIAYNAVVDALGQPDWKIDPRRVLRGFKQIPGGDLARLLAVSAVLVDEDATIDLSGYAPTQLTLSKIAIRAESGRELVEKTGDLTETGRNGPTVLVVGDSFTRDLWRDFFALHAHRYLWIYHEHCHFDRDVLDRYDPDIVILAPIEPYMFCRDRKGAG
jgi:alginate O-acetyltransferase complex protein AlgJ